MAVKQYRPTTPTRRFTSVVSREDIIDSVWGADAEPNSNLVDRHIRDLRRKLQDDWRRPNVLATMRGQGYMVPITD